MTTKKIKCGRRHIIEVSVPRYVPSDEAKAKAVKEYQEHGGIVEQLKCAVFREEREKMSEAKARKPQCNPIQNNLPVERSPVVTERLYPLNLHRLLNLRKTI